MNKVLIICGPTATGKTSLAATLARKYNGELVSADSRQVYRGMDLVTGKERPEGIKIWLYDVVNPDEDFSVSHWVKLAREAIDEIHKRGKLPIVVGGTGLYISALLAPFQTIDIPPDKELRDQFKTKSLRELQDTIPRGDMNDSDWHNPRRLIRKIEIARASVKKTADMHGYETLLIGLTAPPDILKRRIDERMHARNKAGMSREIACLQNYSHELPAMSAIGVNEFAYAKRQMTWFRKMKNIRWFDISGKGFVGNVASLVRAWYNK